jgi:hypothetical protein
MRNKISLLSIYTANKHRTKLFIKKGENERRKQKLPKLCSHVAQQTNCACGTPDNRRRNFRVPRSIDNSTTYTKVFRKLLNRVQCRHVCVAQRHGVQSLTLTPEHISITLTPEHISITLIPEHISRTLTPEHISITLIP